MSKKEPRMIMTISYGYPYKDVFEIYNDISSAKRISPNHVRIERDNGESYEVQSGDIDGVNKIYAVAVGVIAGRNYGA